MDDQPHVRLVNAHAKGIGSYHDANAVVLPVALPLVFFRLLYPCMIEGGLKSGFVQVFGQFLRAFPAAYIYDS